MPINAQCSQCGATLPVPDEFAGKAVRCGGCQSVVNVPMVSVPVAKPVASTNAAPVARPRARPIAAPVVAKTKRAASVEDEKPVRKARKAKPEESEDEELEAEEPQAEPRRRRPIAKRRRESVMTPTGMKWLMLFLMTGVVGLGVLGYAAWGGNQKNDGTALVPVQAQPQPRQPIPLPPPRAPQERLEFDAPRE